MIGGFFKWHWNNPQEITYKIDEPNHPLNAPFKKLSGPLVINDETYTMGRDTYSRQNVRVLTSVDYSKMCDEDKKKELNPREDHDYALSWIKRDGKGRVFYVTHGHDESVYAKTPILEHLLAGMQYALGDLQVDDSPSVKGGNEVATSQFPTPNFQLPSHSLRRELGLGVAWELAGIGSWECAWDRGTLDLKLESIFLPR